jgi:hypothetical protein
MGDKTLDAELREFNRKRDFLFRNLTLAAAKVHLKEMGITQFEREDVALATAHKARLQWLEATNDMITESIAWLTEHGYETTYHGAPPLTPEKRDSDRVEIGKKPLGEE